MSNFICNSGVYIYWKLHNIMGLRCEATAIVMVMLKLNGIHVVVLFSELFLMLTGVHVERGAEGCLPL